ncbi:type I-C CRISPR-associated protein Cas8c/Csd1 [Lachnospiraceae bacterium ASD3451]|uniref:type I-C CRISPR-associated protein Cas8c/Csd1 n=1 Tax=Diplocloster agilis TaxID=2850323 RepID=UPI001D7DD905|nr:type I-C CRISPR-associated protein Cas8c/Csd1 [Diplocloster agilis]MBU9744586.1 type I-C CRISPR-associated protein Cas8c/Csd1 [Diplocloster agilis]
MILQSLVQYYETLSERNEITRQGWCTAKVSFALDLSEDGELLRVIPLKHPEVRGKKTVEVPQKKTVPQMVSRASGVVANFLCDNSSYLLGIDNKGKPKRSVECFKCAREKHMEILRGLDSIPARAVIRFFEKWNPEEAASHPALAEYLEEIQGGANLIFNVGSQFVHEVNGIVKAWDDYCNSRQDEVTGICLVTGRRGGIARIHGTIKGGRDAQPMGALLVSFNAPAFESYGKEQSFNAPVGHYAVYAYTTALNHLLADREHTTTIGDTTIVYWSEDGDVIYQNVFAAVSEPSLENQEIVDGVFKNLASGKGIDVPDVEEKLSSDQNFYILGLAPNAARIAVRFFYQDSFGNILRNIKAHYDRMKIVRPATDGIEYMGIWRMLQETVNKKSRDKKPVPNVAAAVYRAIISGARYPNALYQSVMGRIRAEQDDKDARIYKITRGRAAIIKAFLIRNGNQTKEEITMALNEECTNTAYILGREFAVLEAIQEEANPGINATIKDRYFNAACATPAVIFPILLKLKNSHIRKMKDVKHKVYYEKLLGGLEDKLQVEDGQQTACPKRLSLEEQGMFILGYYHQTQKRYEKKIKEEA